MAQQQSNDLTLGSGLIRKGEARGASPALAVRAKAEETKLETAPPPAVAPPPASAALNEDEEPPLRAAPPDDVAKRFTSFRLPVSLDEDLRAMMFETRRSKQDLLIDFVTAGVKAWRRDRAKRG